LAVSAGKTRPEVAFHLARVGWGVAALVALITGLNGAEPEKPGCARR